MAAGIEAGEWTYREQHVGPLGLQALLVGVDLCTTDD